MGKTSLIVVLATLANALKLTLDTTVKTSLTPVFQTLVQMVECVLQVAVAILVNVLQLTLEKTMEP